jgi:hypothetical protein
MTIRYDTTDQCTITETATCDLFAEFHTDLHFTGPDLRVLLRFPCSKAFVFIWGWSVTLFVSRIYEAVSFHETFATRLGWLYRGCVCHSDLFVREGDAWLYYDSGVVVQTGQAHGV